MTEEHNETTTVEAEEICWAHSAAKAARAAKRARKIAANRAKRTQKLTAASTPSTKAAPVAKRPIPETGGHHLPKRQYVVAIDRIHVKWGRLVRRVEIAEMALQNNSNVEFPYNHARETVLNLAGTAVGITKIEKGRAAIRRVERYAGWLEELAVNAEDLPHVINCLAGLSDYGMNSPRTWATEPYDFPKVHGNPWQMESYIRRVLYRAAQILKPFGIRPGYGRVLRCVCKSHREWGWWGSPGEPGDFRKKARPGRLAKMIALETVNQWLRFRGFPTLNRLEQALGFYGLFTGYNGAWTRHKKHAVRLAAHEIPSGTITEWVERAISYKWEKSIRAGIPAVVTPTVRCIAGIESRRYISDKPMEDIDRFGGCGWLFSHPTLGSYHHQGMSHSNGLRRAVQAFRERKTLLSRNLDKVLNLSKDRTILVYRGDSFRAGNCDEGTDLWMEERGMANVAVSSVTTLLEMAGNNAFALRVVKKALELADEAGVLKEAA